MRNFIDGAAQAIFVGPTPASGAHPANLIKQIHRGTTYSLSWNTPRQGVLSLGQRAELGKIIVEPPTVDLSFTYNLTNALNEQRLGFTVDGTLSCISGILKREQDEKNYFIKLAPEGSDAIGYIGGAANEEVYGVGNGFITNYTVNAQVGQIPTVNIAVQGSNVEYYTTSSGEQIPYVDSYGQLTAETFVLPTATSGLAGQAIALRPADIQLSIQRAVGYSVSDLKPQSASISIDLARNPLNKLGSFFPYYRALQTPINVSVNATFNHGDLERSGLSSLLCNDIPQDITLTLREPNCSGQGDVAIQYVVKRCYINSQSTQINVGDPTQQLTIAFQSTVGGPEDQTNGVFISGKTS